MIIRQKISDILRKIILEEVIIDISVPDSDSNGHYSTNVAFSLSKLRKKPPMIVAEELKKEIEKIAPKQLFGEILVAAPGFLNFYISDSAWKDELFEILEKQKDYGKIKRTKKEKLKIQVEFVSANPTGPLTMANGRGGFFGDVLSNVLRWMGHEVTKEYFVNDAGNQIKLLGESILAATGEIPIKENYYKGDYIKKLKGKSAARAVAALLKDIKKSLKSAGINHDVWFSEEKNIRKKGAIKKTLDILENSGSVDKKDGALWFGDSVLIKSDGSPTYLLVDLAYHYDKLEKRKFDLVIDIWGADHHGNVAPLKNGVEALGIDSGKLKVLLIQLVRLVSDGKETRMSKRAGEFVTLDDLISEVGKDATRFFFVMYSPETHMDFDLKLAKERSQKNPVYYVQYALVRCVGILGKLGVKNRKFKINPDLLNTPEDRALIRTLARMPEEIEVAAKELRVHGLTRYSLELARAFHGFYEKERIIGEKNKDLSEARLALVMATKIIFENLFDVLGISKPKKM